MSGLVGILLSVLGFTSVVDKNGIDSMHPVIHTDINFRVTDSVARIRLAVSTTLRGYDLTSILTLVT